MVGEDRPLTPRNLQKVKRGVRGAGWDGGTVEG